MTYIAQKWRCSAAVCSALLVLAVFTIGSLRDPDFWSTPDQRGEALLRAGEFSQAAKTFINPWRVAVAQYRNGDFEAAAKTFARVPGATGAFDQGNAWLMHGNYEAAIASYNRALGFHHGWKEAEENKALAIARRKLMELSDKRTPQEPTEEYDADKIVFDQKGADKRASPEEMSEGDVSDEQMRATWLRKVQTTPGDFLRAKFAFQAAQFEQKEAKETKGEEK